MVLPFKGPFIWVNVTRKRAWLKRLVLFPLCVFFVFISTSVPSVIAGEKGSMTIDTVIFRAMFFQTECQVYMVLAQKPGGFKDCFSLPPYNIWKK